MLLKHRLISTRPRRWTSEEREKFVHLCDQYGTQFERISEGLDGRSPAACQSFYYRTATEGRYDSDAAISIDSDDAVSVTPRPRRKKKRKLRKSTKKIAPRESHANPPGDGAISVAPRPRRKRRKLRKNAEKIVPAESHANPPGDREDAETIVDAEGAAKAADDPATAGGDRDTKEKYRDGFNTRHCEICNWLMVITQPKPRLEMMEKYAARFIKEGLDSVDAIKMHCTSSFLSKHVQMATGHKVIF